MIFIEALKESILGQDGKAQGKAISAYVVLLLIILIVFSTIVFIIYALVRNSLISENELAASHYLIEILIVLCSLKLALWGASAWSAVAFAKIQNPQSQPPANVTNIQTDKNIVN